MGKTRILESDENNENYYELEKKASEMMPSKETLPTKISVTKLPTTHKDYNLKELHLAYRDLYKSLLKVIQGVLNVEFVDTVGIKIYSTTTEDLQKDTVSSVCRIYFTDDKTNNSIVGYAVLYVREKQIEINGDLQPCYVARGSSVIFEEFRGKTQAAGFSIQYLEKFISNHNDKPTFLFSESVSPLTLYMLMKYIDGLVGLPNTLIELRDNDTTQLKDFLTQISINAPFDLHKVCDSITRIIEPNTEQLDVYNESGRIHFHKAFIEKVAYLSDNNYKKDFAFKLFENVNYYYTDGWAIPTIILVDHNTIKLQNGMLKLAESFVQITKTLSTFSFPTSLLTCCLASSETEVDYDDMVRNKKVLSLVPNASRRSSIDSSTLGRLEDYEELGNFQYGEVYNMHNYEAKMGGDNIDTESSNVPE